MGRAFDIRNEIAVDATPEQVWQAIATGPGIDSWFMGRNEVEPREGGTVTMTVAGAPMISTVTAWEPRHRFAHRSGEAEDGTFHAFEYLIEGRDAGSTVVRLVHSGFLGNDDWAAEYDGLTKGDRMYAYKLAAYLDHFVGQVATATVMVFGPQVPDPERAWTTLRTGLGLAGPVQEGDPVRLTPAGLDPIEGVVDYATPEFLGVRSKDGLHRFMHGYQDTVVVEQQLFGSDLDAGQIEQAWQAWLAVVFG
jgi:uncharacterized protein YndB with AHSA1/START domain